MTKIIEGESPVGKDEERSVLLFQESLGKVVSKLDSSEPASIGDQLVKIALTLSYERRKGLPIRSSLVEAERLLALYNGK